MGKLLSLQFSIMYGNTELSERVANAHCIALSAKKYSFAPALKSIHLHFPNLIPVETGAVQGL